MAINHVGVCVSFVLSHVGVSIKVVFSVGLEVGVIVVSSVGICVMLVIFFIVLGIGIVNAHVVDVAPSLA